MRELLLRDIRAFHGRLDVVYRNHQDRGLVGSRCAQQVQPGGAAEIDLVAELADESDLLRIAVERGERYAARGEPRILFSLTLTRDHFRAGLLHSLANHAG